MRVLGFHPATLAATCMLLVAGCGGVTFESPLSDETTTRFDERLVGYWEPLPASVGQEEPSPGDLWHHLVVGRLAEQEHLMEAVVLDVDSGVVKVTRIRMHPTRIGDHRYLSLINPEEAEKGYFVIRYDLPADDRLRFQVLDEAVFAKAVRRGLLKGDVAASEGDAEAEAKNPHVTSTTAELRAWIEAHADTCVSPKRVTLRRLVERESEGEAELPEPPEPPAPPQEPDDDADDSKGPDEEDDAEDQE